MAGLLRGAHLFAKQYATGRIRLYGTMIKNDDYPKRYLLFTDYRVL